MLSVEMKIERCRRSIRRLMKDRGIMQSQWSRSAGLDVSVLGKFLRGESRSMQLDSLLKLADVHQLTIAEMVGEV